MNRAGEIRKDHLVFISDDLQHDYISVELLNKKIHEYYACEWSEASLTVRNDDIAIICTDDPYYPYYLIKLNSDPYLTTTQIIDDYRHTFPPDHASCC